MEFTSARGFGHVSEVASLGQHGFNNFSDLSRLVLKKGGFTPMLDSLKKGIFLLKKAFLEEPQVEVRWLSCQFQVLS